jgi:hypothetical protein
LENISNVSLKQTAIIAAFTNLILFIFQNQEYIAISQKILTILYLLLNGMSINKLLKNEKALQNVKEVYLSYKNFNQ